jgi:hypothetical protein
LICARADGIVLLRVQHDHRGQRRAAGLLAAGLLAAAHAGGRRAVIELCGGP